VLVGVVLHRGAIPSFAARPIRNEHLPGSILGRIISNVFGMTPITSRRLSHLSQQCHLQLVWTNYTCKCMANLAARERCASWWSSAGDPFLR